MLNPAIHRRHFLKMVGWGTAALATSFGIEAASGVLTFDTPEVFPPNGPESRIASVCGMCPAGCGLMVRKIGERAVQVTGNPLNPINSGGLCPVGQASLQLVYNPDRLRAPVRRVGPRGSGKWRQISWDEAFTAIRSRLAELRAASQTQTVVAMSGGTSELGDRLTARFLRAYGSPSFILDPAAAPSGGQELTQGVSRRVAYDLENARYLLSFGSSLLESGMSPARQMRAVADFHASKLGRRGKLVQIESRYSATAARSDEWIPVNPGSEWILALGIAHILVKYNLFDRGFVERHVDGFDDWTDKQGYRHSGLRSLLLAKYDIDAVAAATGVPVAAIDRIAHEFVNVKPAVAIPADFHYSPAHRMRCAQAVQVLNVISGAVDRPGGVLVREDPPLSEWKAVSQDPVAALGLRRQPIENLEALAVALRENRPCPVEAVLFLGCNPLFTNPDMLDALDRVSLIVSVATLLDETANYADIVLPDCTALERWEIHSGSPGFALKSFAVGAPALVPRYQSRPWSEAIVQLAKSFGGAVADAFPWKGIDEAIEELSAGLAEWPHGEVFGERFKADYLDPQMRAWDWPAQKFPDRETFRKRLVARGGWVDPRYRYEDYSRTIRTPSGKIEGVGIVEALADPIAADPASGEYPFALNIFKPLPMMSGVSANLPSLQEVAGTPQDWPWDSCVEINPATARKLGINHGDLVRVKSPHGRLTARANLYPGAMPNVVSLAFGQGHQLLGGWGSRRGVNPLGLAGSQTIVKVNITRV